MGGVGDLRHHLMSNFHFHLPHLLRHHHHDHGGDSDDDDDHHHRTARGSSFCDLKGIPKGCLAIIVGNQGDQEELQRFVIPVLYINHPLFVQLLKEAEEEYGFHHDGPITLPCHVEEFRNIRGMIDRDHHHHKSPFLHHHHDHPHGGGGHCHFLCFKA